jgi:hypothetical protein
MNVIRAINPIQIASLGLDSGTKPKGMNQKRNWVINYRD